MLNVLDRWRRPNSCAPIIAVLALGAVAVQAGDATISEGRQQQLVHLVRQDCGSCHGMTLRGGLGGPLLPGNLDNYDREALAGIILKGIPGKPMPAWDRHLSEQEVLWIVDNLKKGFPK